MMIIIIITQIIQDNLLDYIYIIIVHFSSHHGIYSSIVFIVVFTCIVHMTTTQKLSAHGLSGLVCFALEHIVGGATQLDLLCQPRNNCQEKTKQDENVNSVLK